MTPDLPEEDLPPVEFYDPTEWENDPESIGGHPPLLPTVDHGPVQVWLRNPNEYMRVLKESPYSKFSFTLAEQKRGKHPYSLLCSVLPSDMDFEWLSVTRTSILHCTRSGYENKTEPIRIPVWAHGTNPEVLLRYCRNAEANGYSTIGVGFLPRARDAKMHQRQTLEWLYRIAAQYPHIKFHYIFGTVWRHLFGLNFASVDFNPAYSAKFKRIWLPNGDGATTDGLHRRLKWIHVLGYSAAELKTYEGRVRFNIAAALWAAEHYREAEPITTRQKRLTDDPLGLMTARASRKVDKYSERRKPTLTQKLAQPTLDPDQYPQSSPDPDEPYHMVQPVTNTAPVPVKPKRNADQDKIVCNSCSLASTCLVYREGAICAVPTSPTSRLATMYGTRDVETIKGALAEVLAKQVERYERSAERFREDEESDVVDLKRSAHLLKMETSLVRSTETFMKILDPQFRESNIPAIQNNTMHVYNPRVLVADVVKQLEESGIDRAQLTPEMIQQAISAQPKVIEG